MLNEYLSSYIFTDGPASVNKILLLCSYAFFELNYPALYPIMND